LQAKPNKNAVVGRGQISPQDCFCGRQRENQDCHSASRKRAVRVYACERLSEREREREVAAIENGDIRRSEGLGNTGLLL